MTTTKAMDETGPEHEGWTNLETFTVAMFYSNDEYRNTWIKDLANGRLEEAYGVSAKVDILEDSVYDYAKGSHVLDADFSGDLITAALARVNYREIIEYHRAGLMYRRPNWLKRM